MGNLKDTLKKYDKHSSVSNEYRVHTAQGAVLSVVTLLIIFYLAYTEFVFNFTREIVEKVKVNATSPRGLEIEIDITLHSVPCALLSVDANDPTGQRQSLHLDKKHHVWKHRLSPEGFFMGRRDQLELGSTLLQEDHLLEHAKQKGNNDGDGQDLTLEDIKLRPDDSSSPRELNEDDCGSCYGAGEEGECCNSCEDVKRAYVRRGWIMNNYNEIDQCKNEMSSEAEKDEGCNVHGKVALDTGGGNLHLAPSRGMESFGKEQGKTVNILEVFLQTFEQFNVSHTIHKLRFGDDFPGHVHQLDGEERFIKDGYGMYQYYIQIVPTLFKYLNGTTIQTNQFSVTEHLRHVNPGSGRGLPGVFFFYEVSALHVIIEETRRGWVAFLTSVAAIVGGVVTVMGIVDQVMYASQRKGGLSLSSSLVY